MRTKDRLKRFFAAVVFLGALAAVLLLPTQTYGKWLLGAALALAVLYVWLPQVLEAAARIQNYPKLLEQVVSLQERSPKLHERIASLERSVETALEAGIREGMRRVVGQALAATADPFDLVSVTDSGGELVFVGEYAADALAPSIAARYAVVHVHTGATKGVVEVIDVQEDRRLVFMECVEPTVSSFWDQLEDRAPADSTPPPDIRLNPMTYDWPSPGSGTSRRELAAGRTEEDESDEH